MSEGRKKVGLALGGGAARGIAHIGVLKALRDFQIPVDMVAGVSAGAVVGAFFAAGLDIETMEDKVSQVTWSDFATFHFSKIGMMSSKPIESFIERYIGKMTFAELQKPFATLATDLITGRGVILNSPKALVSTAVRASASFPGVLDPTEIDGRYLCDGGAVENVPISVVRGMGADVVIAVDVIPQVELSRPPAHMMAVVDRGLDILLNNRMKCIASNADIILHPMTEYFASRHFKHSKRMIELGVQSVIQNIDLIQKAIA